MLTWTCGVGGRAEQLAWRGRSFTCDNSIIENRELRDPEEPEWGWEVSLSRKWAARVSGWEMTWPEDIRALEMSWWEPFTSGLGGYVRLNEVRRSVMLFDACVRVEQGTSGSNSTDCSSCNKTSDVRGSGDEVTKESSCNATRWALDVRMLSTVDCEWTEISEGSRDTSHASAVEIE